MSDNVLQTPQKLVQDVIAPDVREVKVRLTELEKRMDINTEMILSAIRQLKAENELETMRAIADLRERTAVLEVRQTQSRSEAA